MHPLEDENGHDRPTAMNRREFVVSGVVTGALAVAGIAIPRRAGAAAANTPTIAPAPQPWTTPDDFPLAEITIDRLQQAMQSGQYTARSITEQYLARIDALDQRGPTVNAVIELNPDALAIADALDAERKAKGPRGPMHGIPVLIKDNVATADRMQSTAGSLALVGGTPPRDAYIVERLRAAGAVIIGKTNLSEWANYPLDPLLQRMERPRRPNPQPVRTRSQPVWVELRIRCRHRVQFLHGSPSAPKPTARSSRRRRTRPSSASSRPSAC